MVYKQFIREATRSGDVQDLEVPGVPESLSKKVRGAPRVWMLNTRLLMAHNAHVKARGLVKDKRCGFCQKGPRAVLGAAKDKAELEAGSVAESDRVDKEGPAPSTHSGREYNRDS